jgi:glycerol-3-phosphate dehydrogenase
MARTIEDVLARRTRSLFLDAKSAMESAGFVGKLLQQQLHRSDDWRQEQLQRFTEVARGFSQPN